MSEPFNLTSFLSVVIEPERLTTIDSWHRHIPFTSVILSLLKPQIFVELGTHRGDSYSAFCQAVVYQELLTRCYAVDTWQGDSQAGFYNNEIFNELTEWHDSRFASFSTMLRMSFDNALEYFSNNSIDLLHIDGLHTYDAVKHDFESWLPKLSNRAVVLFHDTNVRHGDFAVWKLWEELSRCYPSFEFPFGYGLGVLVVGSESPAELLSFLSYAQQHSKQTIDFFYRLGDTAALRKSQLRVSVLDAQTESLGEQLVHARNIVVERDMQLNCANELGLEVKDLTKKLSSIGEDLAISDAQAQYYKSALSIAVEHNRKITRSKFWQARNKVMCLLGRHEKIVDELPLSVCSGGCVLEKRPIVDIIIPVYRNFELTKTAIKSVINSVCSAQFELIVINDCSSDDLLVTWLNDNNQNFTLLHNENNQGFVKTVNRGMSLHPDRDVVLLNSDAEVSNDWLDRLQTAAYSDTSIGSVTPFSNNATIFSYPRFCNDNDLPAGYSLAELDFICSKVNAGQVIEVPTAVGFCMFIRRDCLVSAGLFNAELFGLGYGEENEFCLRSSEFGWRHVLCADTFVYHKGGASFGDTQVENQNKGHRALLSKFPQYDLIIQKFIARDPIAPLRFALDAALTRNSGLPVLLMVSHSRGGGTERHVMDLALQLQGQAVVYLLAPVVEGGEVALGLLDSKHNRMKFDPVTDADLLLNTLQVLGISRVHFHHTIGLALPILFLPERLKCPYDITIHDFYFACPQISLSTISGDFCGAPDEEGCNRCLYSRPAPGNVDILNWRGLGKIMIGGAERVFTPSRDTYLRMNSYFPQGNYIHASHEPELIPVELKLINSRPKRSLKIAVIGALSVIKGADVVESVALESRRQRLPLSFHLLGYAYRRLREKPFSDLEVHGAYQEGHLDSLLHKLSPDLVWFPGNCVETYSYTLSTCLRLGLPVVAPLIGSFPERLGGREWTWLVPPNRSVMEILDHFTIINDALAGRRTPVAAGLLAQPEFVYAQHYLGSTSVVKHTDLQWGKIQALWAEQGNHKSDIVQPRYGDQFIRYIITRPFLQPFFAWVPSRLKQRLKKILLN